MTRTRWVALIAATLILGAAMTVVARPRQAVTWLAGLDRVEGDIHVMRGGRGVPVVLLHGIFDGKESLTLIARKLAGHHAVYVPDLPGYNENERLEAADYAIEEQVRRLMVWADEQELDRFHIAGASMGGAIAAVIAARFPDRVISLGFLGAPFGITGTDVDAATARILNGKQGQDARLSLVAPDAPAYVRWLQILISRNFPSDVAHNSRVWDMVTSGNEGLLARLQFAPTLRVFALWCEDDTIFPVDGARWFTRTFTAPDVLVKSDCGHAPALTIPTDLSWSYLWSLAHMDADVWPPYPRPQR